MMSELVASLVHEINQPLGAILSNLGGLTRLLSQKNPEPAAALAAVNDAIEDTKRTAEIIRRVRFLFKGHRGKPKIAIGIGELVSEVVKLVASEAALRKILVRVEISRSVRRIVGDRVQLQQYMVQEFRIGLRSPIVARRPVRRCLRVYASESFSISIRGQPLWFGSQPVSFERIDSIIILAAARNSGSDEICSKDRC